MSTTYSLLHNLCSDKTSFHHLKFSMKIVHMYVGILRQYYHFLTRNKNRLIFLHPTKRSETILRNIYNYVNEKLVKFLR